MSPTVPAAPAAAPARLRHRRSARRLTAGQAADLRRAISAAQAISDDRGYQHRAGIHGLPLPMYCTHGSPLFLPWHRAYLYFFEKALQDRVAGVTLPWWDWTHDHAEGIPALYAREQAGGQPNPLHGRPIQPSGREPGGPARTAREPGGPGAPPLPTAQQARRRAGAQRLPRLLQTQLEDIHNGVHVWVGGTMARHRDRRLRPAVLGPPRDDRPRSGGCGSCATPPPGRPPALLHRALPPFAMTVAQNARLERAGLRLRRLDRRRPGTGTLMVEPLRQRAARAARRPRRAFSRADLVFYGVDHSGPSFEARVYLDDPDATVGHGPRDAALRRRVHIFGHGGCFGDEGHCDVPSSPPTRSTCARPTSSTPQTKS